MTSRASTSARMVPSALPGVVRLSRLRSLGIRLGIRVEHLAALRCGSQDAFADEVAEACHVREAGGGRGVVTEDLDASAGDFGDFGHAAGAVDGRLVPDVV